MSLFVNTANRYSDDLAPASDPKSRSERWDETIKKIDANFTKYLEQDSSQASLVQLRRPRDAAPAAQSDDHFSVLMAPGVRYPRNTSVAVRPHHLVSRRSLREWIQLQKTRYAGDTAELKRYFESCVTILHSLVLKMIVTVMINGKAELEITTDPKLISMDNLVVNHSLEEGESLHFVTESDDVHDLPANSVDVKYGAMKALGIVAYELMMRGAGPPIMSFLPSTITNSDGTSELLLNLNETSTNENQGSTKRQRGAAGRMQGMLSSAMINAEVPYPLCRFVEDLLGGECSDGLLFRSDNSFDSFLDVLGDLKQMMKNPEAFIHLAVRDQWKLAFGEKMHGREAEKGKLLEVASRITGITSNDALLEALALVHPNDKQQIVMVTGNAGAGKSRLVIETRKSLENHGWLFLCCKFDKIVHSEPLSVMAGAFDEFLLHCIGNSRQIRIMNNLKKMMIPEDIAILAKHVPCLVNYVDGPLQLVNKFQVNSEQIYQLFGKLIEVLSAVGPVVLFADDLQWADATSIGLFFALTKASEPNLSPDGCTKRQSKTLLIGSYRDNEVQDNKQLAEMLDQLKTMKSVEATEIPVGGFDVNTLNMIVSESLCLPLRRTKHLTEVILQKTDGIIIHIIEFIGRLTMERILCHSFVKGWEWDSEVIESCPISESAAELFTFKLKTLSKEALMGLQICSVFGNVDHRIIKFIQGYDGENSVNISLGLQAATELGLIEAAGSPNRFKFAHDLILQAAFDMIPVEERSRLHKKLATTLIKNASASNEIDQFIFVAVDLINRIDNESITDQEERVLFASMNDQAGKKALAVPDFNSAVKYSESAISYLDSSHWETHHDLMLGAHQTSILALYSCATQSRDQFQKRVDAVFANASSLDEEFVARHAWIRFISVTSPQTAISECHKVLERLREPISLDTSPADACSELVRVKNAFKEKKQISNFMVHPEKLKAMKIMATMFPFYFFQRNRIALLVSSRMVELSMEYGCCEDSFFALASFGALLVTILGDIDEGCSWSRMTLQLLSSSRYNINLIIPRVLLAAYGYSLLWKEPLQGTLEHLVRGCQLAFDYGDVNFAVNIAHMYSNRAFRCGKNVNAHLEEIKSLANMCGIHRHFTTIQHAFAPLFNVLMCLKGMNEQPLAPLDVYLSNDDLLTKKDEMEPLCYEWQILLALIKHLVMRDMEKAKEMADLGKATFKMKTLALFYVDFDLYAGLTACYFARHNGDNSQLEEVQKTCNQLSHLCSYSKWNMEHKYHLLKAEYYYSIRENEKAIDAYQKAINAAKEHKFTHEMAIGCELAGYFYKEQGDEVKAREMFDQARKAYIEWGADRKANDLVRFVTPTKS